MFVALSAWIAAFVFFKNSDTWSEAKSIIRTNNQFPIDPQADISPELKGFSYRFSGDYEAFQLNVHCKGSKDDRHFHVEFERQNGRLKMLGMRPD